MDAAVETLFSKLIVGVPLSILGVEVVPLFMRESALATDALLLEEGIETGRTVVNEIDDAGVVGQVRVRHRGPLPLLVLQGEQILGAKQNRTFNASFVVGPEREVVLPVSCVEHGRWQKKSEAFSAGSTTLAPELRARKLKRLNESIRASGTYDANQHEVWAGVRQYMAATGTYSVTSSFEDARRSRAAETERTLQALTPFPGQTGLAVVRDGRMTMLDVFGSPELFARAFKKCLRGALSEARLSATSPVSASTSAMELVKRALRDFAEAPPTRAKSPADGDTWTGSAASATYAACVWNGRVYHCAAAS